MIWSTIPHNPHGGWEFPAQRPKIWEKHRTRVNNNNRIHAKWLAYDTLSAIFFLTSIYKPYLSPFQFSCIWITWCSEYWSLCGCMTPFTRVKIIMASSLHVCEFSGCVLIWWRGQKLYFLLWKYDITLTNSKTRIFGKSPFYDPHQFTLSL